MNLKRIKELTLQIKELQAELDIEKNTVLESFRNMSEEDIALCDKVISDKGIKIQYFEKSTAKRVNSSLLKRDGLYDKYATEYNKSDYIKVTVKG